MPPTTPRARLAAVAAVVLCASLVSACQFRKPSPPPSPSIDPGVPVFSVVQEGLTAADANALAAQFGISPALEATGAFDYVNPDTFAHVPLSAAIDAGTDESGNPVVRQSIDTTALSFLTPISDQAALTLAGPLTDLSGYSADLVAVPQVSHTVLTLAPPVGDPTQTNLDTVVTMGLTLAGLPVTGPGATVRVAFDPSGAVSQLAVRLRHLQRGDLVPVISVDDATAACTAIYGGQVVQAPPTLAYELPALTSTQADGHGSIQTIFPQYTCNPMVDGSPQAGRLVPAVADSAPVGTLSASRAGQEIVGSVSDVHGGTPPYHYTWSDTTGVAAAGVTMSYQRKQRSATITAETVTVQVADVNGLTSTASVILHGDETRTDTSHPGGGGLAALDLTHVDAGAETPLDSWACANSSVTGFEQGLAAHGVPAAFDWRGDNAWEADFKDATSTGQDSLWIDNVDIGWFTGHGAPGTLLFNGDHDDSALTAADAAWGNRDLEWLQLEACYSMQDPAGWAGSALSGIHLVNGFVGLAYCLDGGTGAAFAANLFGRALQVGSVKALTVTQAWQAMAVAAEPVGVQFRSTGPLGAGSQANVGDYFWGQGSTTADIPQGQQHGWWAITGTV